MSLFDSESPIGHYVNGVYDILRIPVRAITQSWSHAHPRDKSHIRNVSSRRGSYVRDRKEPVEVPLAFENSNAQRYIYATSRKRQWKGSNWLEGSMSSPNSKRQKTHHLGSSISSPWSQKGWAQGSRNDVEHVIKKQSINGRHKTPAQFHRSRSNLLTKSRVDDYGTPVTNNPTIKVFGRSGSRFTQQISPASLSRATRRVSRITPSPDSSPDRDTQQKTFKMIEGKYRVPVLESRKETPSQSETAASTVPDRLQDNAIVGRSKYAFSAVQPPTNIKLTPPLSPHQKEDDLESLKGDRKQGRHDSSVEDYTDTFNGFDPSPSPEPEVKPQIKSLARTPVPTKNLIRSFFSRQSDPVQSSPGAFPQTESENSSEELETGRSDDESDSSEEQPKRYQSPDVPRRPNSKHTAQPRRHSIDQSHTTTPGFTGRMRGPPSVLDYFLSPFKTKTNDRTRPTEIPDITNLRITSRRPKSEIWSHSKTDRQTREQKIKEDREAALARGQYALVPLSDEWDRKVRQAVRQGTPDGKYSPTDFARVVPEYASPPQRSKWLNDAVINDYVALVARHGNKDDRKDQVPTFAALSSFFYSKLAQDPKNAPASWTRRAKIPGKALLDCAMVFIPINEGAHWTLCVIEPKDKRRITMYNSMGHGRNDSHARIVYAWVRHHLGAAFVEDEWNIDSRGVSPQQDNTDDCGVFTCTTARQLMLGQMEKTPYDHTVMIVQRRRMVAELLNGGLIKADDDA